MVRTRLRSRRRKPGPRSMSQAFRFLKKMKHDNRLSHGKIAKIDQSNCVSEDVERG
ncbi:hypothetical protein ABIF33_008016 [Bradyrhizobium elkanii]